MMDNLETSLPKAAVEVKITNILNPYYIRLYEVQHFNSQKQKLSIQLQKQLNLIKKSAPSAEHTKKPLVGDDILISHDSNEDLPAWICRGKVLDIESGKATIFLIDFGHSIKASLESVIKYSPNSIPIQPLTTTVSLDNILPIDSAGNLLKVWNKSTIDSIKYYTLNSKKVFFKTTSYDIKTKKKFGEIYLLIAEKYYQLTKILVKSCLATILNDKLLKAIINNERKDQIILLNDAPEIIKNKSKSDKSFLNEIKQLSSATPSASNTISLTKKKLVYDKVLVKSNYDCTPLNDISDARFTSSIHKALKCQGVWQPKQIQSYIWPAFKKKLDIVAIDAKSAGKTVSYIVGIANYLSENEIAIMKKAKASLETKPIALILCKSVNQCLDVAKKISTLLECTKCRVFGAANSITNKEIMVEICNKFQVMVATPPLLLKILENFSNKLDVSELSFLVLDEADIILDKYLSQVLLLIQKYKIIFKNKSVIESETTQVICVSRTWTLQIGDFIHKFMVSPYICIGSYIEAASFSRVQGRMLIRLSSKKNEEVLKVLSNYREVKTMIVCTHNQEAIDLDHYFRSESVETLLIHNNMLATTINQAREAWHHFLPGMYPVIICTDDVLTDLHIWSIEYLIHYSLTDSSKTQFNRRFCVFMDNWERDKKINCKNLILFDETKEYVHFKGMVAILKRLNVELPKDWDKIAEGLDLKGNMKIKNHPLCVKTKSFGSCNLDTCSYRHRVISEVDTPILNINIGDELKIHITHIFSASHFAARILECITKCKSTGKRQIIPLSYNIFKINKELKKYYDSLENKRSVENVDIGQFYLWKDRSNNLIRLQVLLIVEKVPETKKPKYIRARNIDNGKIIEKISAHELVDIPENLLKEETPIIDIFLTSISHHEDESDWTDLAKDYTKSWIKNNTSEQLSLHAQVELQIGYSIFTKTLIPRQKVKGFQDLSGESLAAALLKENHGISNNKNLPNLLKLCQKAGFKDLNYGSTKPHCDSVEEIET
ncbi:putative ATP-dependent RNA helicase TDRD12 [Trichogramma pretiosum]|uniref:putative ATP-dependent RNA helicase TDRD12 n=1 Tax=Trichogramma pretiosum TaxID=7493 RepID=UPI0006C98096|nr:putative ATP-dependent RNA helicase TDRD12 [Trichogramma pretiosum]